MINLQIDTADLADEFSLSNEEVKSMLQYTVEEVGSAFARSWEIEAKNGLKSTRSQYVNAIQIRKIDRLTCAVYLNPAAWLANAIEMGKSSFDMKKGLLASKKVKYTSKGKPYITIPFRFGVPSSMGENAAFAGVMPQEVYAVAKNLQPKKQVQLSQIPGQYQIPKNIGLRRQVKSGNFDNITKRTKMTSIYEGMTKSNSGYVTFRRVSLNSDSDSWIHPGFQARDFAGKALAELNVPQVVDISIDDFLNKLGF